MREYQCRNWKYILGFDGCFSVDCKGKSGGLTLLWKTPLHVDLNSYSTGHIDCRVREGEHQWRFTGFYGHPDSSWRNDSWKLLQRLCSIDTLRDLPWLVGGDFNEICFDSEKLGGTHRSLAHMSAFREVLATCSLQDLSCEGNFFTWTNRRDENNIILERPDRFTGTLEWRMLYPTARIKSLEFYHSDHRPILLELRKCSTEAIRHTLPNSRRFRFEPMWVVEDECSSVIELGWNAVRSEAVLSERIRTCSQHLQEWAQHKFKTLPNRIRTEREALNILKSDIGWQGSTSAIREKEILVERLCSQEELYWKQRSRISGLQRGDRNSKFFHAQASQRHSKNTIHGLISTQGDFATDSTAMAEIILDYFGSLFSSMNPTEDELAAVLNTVEPRVTPHMNRVLYAPFSADDVKKALFDMSPDKAPGPDGMLAMFYQKFWHIIGKEITTAVLKILNEGEPTHDWNETTVTLIPKVDNPMMMKEFRPISLSRVCYKIVAKALTNRLCPMLSQIVDDYQCAFIPNRLISDNIILGFECTHWMRNYRQEKCGYAALKLDMSKAYDRIEWKFLQEVMGKLGFDPIWTEKS